MRHLSKSGAFFVYDFVMFYRQMLLLLRKMCILFVYLTKK